MHRLSSAALFLLAAASASANEPRVVAVVPHCNEEKTVCKFDVTIEHADTGWDHYANQWDVVAPDGKVLGTRVLRHPHVEEQPFTRSMRAIRIPEGVHTVKIRAKDSVHGYAREAFAVEIE